MSDKSQGTSGKRLEPIRKLCLLNKGMMRFNHSIQSKRADMRAQAP